MKIFDKKGVGVLLSYDLNHQILEQGKVVGEFDYWPQNLFSHSSLQYVHTKQKKVISRSQGAAA